MKYLSVYFALIALFLGSQILAQTGASPLAKFAPEWSNARYTACNTAANARYMSGEEREAIYILNLARMNPKLFCQSVLLKAPTLLSNVDTSSEVYYKSLIARLMTMEPLPILKPDSLSYVSAYCHRASTGKTGYVGHDRKTPECRKKQHFSGECCQYGFNSPLAMILYLLIDEDVPSLGHRDICLGGYKLVGVSMGEHKTFETMGVLDFNF